MMLLNFAISDIYSQSPNIEVSEPLQNVSISLSRH